MALPDTVAAHPSKVDKSDKARCLVEIALLVCTFAMKRFVWSRKIAQEITFSLRL